MGLMSNQTKKWKKWAVLAAVMTSLASFTVGCSKGGSGSSNNGNNITSCTSSGCVNLNANGEFASATGLLAKGWENFGTMSLIMIAQNPAANFGSMSTQEIADHWIGQVPNQIGAFGVRGRMRVDYPVDNTCGMPAGDYDLQTVQVGQWSGKHGDNTVILEARGVSGSASGVKARVRMSVNITGNLGNYQGLDSNGNMVSGFEYGINADPVVFETVNGVNCGRWSSVLNR